MGSAGGDPMTAFGRPTAEELLEAVREFLTEDVMPATDGRVRYHARVAANVVAMVERELADNGTVAARQQERLRALGVEDEAALAAAIRDGEFDDRIDALASELRASAEDRLAVTNPGYTAPPSE